MLTSLCVTSRSGDAFYVTIKPSDKLWDLCILDGKGVKTVADVQQLAIDHSHRDRAKIPGPLFRCLVVHVEETNSAAMVMYREYSQFLVVNWQLTASKCITLSKTHHP